MKYTTGHILEYLEEWAPQSTKLEYDNVGLLVGDRNQQTEKVLTCLDITPDIIDEAISRQADLIVAHHPLIFRKLSRVTPDNMTGSLIYRLIKNDISLIAAHTNLDAAYGGVSFVMAERLGLKHVSFLKEVPISGQNGSAATPQRIVSGEAGTAQETAAGHKGLPVTERPAISERTGFGAIGELPEEMSLTGFLTHVQKSLECRGIRYGGTADPIKKVAVCGGSGSFLTDEAVRQQADAFVTADLKYHDFFTETPSFLLVDAGHYESEVPITGTLCDRLTDRFPGLEVLPTSRNTNPVNYFFHDY